MIDFKPAPAVVAHHPKLAYTTDILTENTSGRTYGANVAVGVRVNMPETGTLDRLAVWIVTQNGNIDVGIYDTTATTRNKLVSSGTTACAAAAAWQQFTISLAVRAGDAVDFAFAADGTASIASGSSGTVGIGNLPSGWVAVSLGGAPRLAWQISTSFVLPATLTEASLANITSGYVPVIIARYS